MKRQNGISKMKSINMGIVVQPAAQPVVDYAAALRQYQKYGRGRSMKKFCEDDGYDYW